MARSTPQGPPLPVPSKTGLRPDGLFRGGSARVSVRSCARAAGLCPVYQKGARSMGPLPRAPSRVPPPELSGLCCFHRCSGCLEVGGTLAGFTPASLVMPLLKKDTPVFSGCVPPWLPGGRNGGGRGGPFAGETASPATQTGASVWDRLRGRWAPLPLRLPETQAPSLKWAE